ncbi:hypothetical protein [Microbacterium sp. YY-01]|uniref:hypothetical protein n=1 Tax=Microbacterium sp. YY-01 TaxID=3421634 RepID=UPI003D16F276
MPFQTSSMVDASETMRASRSPVKCSVFQGVEKAYAFVDLLEDHGSLYKQLPSNVRRDLPTAFFSRLDVHVTDRNVKIDSQRTEINEALHDLRSSPTQHRSNHFDQNEEDLPRFRGRSSFKTRQFYSVQRFE